MSQDIVPFRFLSCALLVSPLLGCSTVMEETNAELPCLVDGKQVGTYTRTLKTGGTLVYVFDETCNGHPSEKKPG